MSSLMELIAQKKKDIQANSGSKTAKVPDGTSSWRLLPRWDGNMEGEFWHDFGQHYIKDTKGQTKAVYVCADKTFGKPCEVCDAIAQGIMQSANDDIKKAMEDAKSSSRVLVNAVNVSGDKRAAELLELPPSVFAQILGIVGEWGVQEMLALTGGRVIMIEKTGKGLNTKYSAQAGSRKEDIAEAVFKQATNLDEYVQQESVEKQRRALANLNQVAGLLAAPGTASDKPDLASVAAELDTLTDIPDEVTRLTPAQPAATVVDTPATPPAAATAAAVPSSVPSSGDPELDKMLAELGG